MLKEIHLIPEEIKSKYPKFHTSGCAQEDKELYAEANAKAIEIFGKNSNAYEILTNGINFDNFTGSQFFWNLWLNKFTPKNKRVISLENAELINDYDGDFFKDFCTDIPELILRTEILSWKNNKQILEYLVKQTKNAGLDFSSEIPLIFSGLEIIKDESSAGSYYGLLLEFGKNTKFVYDKRFAYSNNTRKIPFGKNKKQFIQKRMVCLKFA